MSWYIQKKRKKNWYIKNNNILTGHKHFEQLYSLHDQVWHERLIAVASHNQTFFQSEYEEVQMRLRHWRFSVNNEFSCLFFLTQSYNVPWEDFKTDMSRVAPFLLNIFLHLENCKHENCKQEK